MEDRTDYKQAASFWLEKDARAPKLDRAVVYGEMERFIRAHNTCALATCDLEGNVRATPIEYIFKDGFFWLLSEGGLKFRGLEVNKKVSLAIFDPFTGFKNLGGLQLDGRAEVIEPWSEAYLDFLACKHIDPEKFREMPIVMHLIKITPLAADFISAKLGELGGGYRQHWDSEAQA